MRPTILIFLISLTAVSRGLELPSPFPSAGQPAAWSLFWENDRLSMDNRDRYYTQGLRLAVNNANGAYAALTQEINTPADTTTANPAASDLPYSAALYFSYGQGRVLERGGRRDCLLVWEAQLGVIGPAAGGPTIQNSIHRLIGVPVVQGWQTQLPNELVANVDIEFRKRFLADGSGRGLRDVLARAAAEFGTLRTEFLLGAQVRWGRGLDLSWGATTIRQSVAYDPVARFDASSGRSAYAAWFYLDAQVEVVVRNYSTDGANFRGSRGVPREPVVGQLAIGYSYQVSRFAATVYTSLRTDEFAAQKSLHGVGGIKLDLLF
jgi:lipid A 3-O-deacylase